MMKSGVRVDLGALHKLSGLFRSVQAGSPGSSAVSKAMLQWGALYSSYIRERFLKQSRGGGEWPPLKPSTIKRRRKGKKGKKGKPAILFDTGSLYGALDPVFQPSKGQLRTHIPNGIRVGYGGEGRHPNSDLTIAELAAVHQFGSRKNNLPARRIIVPPTENAALVRRMAKLMRDALAKDLRTIIA